MAQALQVDLNAEQTKELSWTRDHHQKSYVRVKAAAILKVASGLSVRQVALHGLLKPVAQETVSEWIRRYQTEGLEGLLVQAGRGRKPAFSPCGPGAGAKPPIRWPRWSIAPLSSLVSIAPPGPWVASVP